MNLSDVGEDVLVAKILSALRVRGEDVEVAAGDDCAVVRASGRILLKTDCLIEGVHFLDSHPPDKVGWKAMARVLSDMAAMGARPRHALVTAAFPESYRVRDVLRMYRGLERAAGRFGVTIVGGETAKSPGPVFISVALTGSPGPRGYVKRSGGRAGDALLVTGVLGKSLRSHHLNFMPRVVEGMWLADNFKPSAMMDLSDGLGADLPRLTRACGLGFEVDPALLPRRRGADVRAAIGDGEDYELLFAITPRKLPALEINWRKRFPKVRLTRIGTLRKGEARELDAPGYQHFH